MIVALTYNDNILQEARYPIPFQSEEACVDKIHEIADKHKLEIMLHVNEDGSSFYKIKEKNGYVTFADCVETVPN